MRKTNKQKAIELAKTDSEFGLNSARYCGKFSGMPLYLAESISQSAVTIICDYYPILINQGVARWAEIEEIEKIMGFSPRA